MRAAAAALLVAAATTLPSVAPRPRVALLLCGHMRTYRSTAPSVRERVLLSAERAGLDVDVFVSTWATGEESAAEISSAYGTSPRTNHSFLQEQHVLLLQERHEAVRMKVVLDGVRKAARDGRVFGSTTHLTTMLYAIKRGMGLIERLGGGRHYRWVIKMRPDIVVWEKWHWPFLLAERNGTEMKPHTVVVPVELAVRVLVDSAYFHDYARNLPTNVGARPPCVQDHILQGDFYAVDKALSGFFDSYSTSPHHVEYPIELDFGIHLKKAHLHVVTDASIVYDLVRTGEVLPGVVTT